MKNLPSCAHILHKTSILVLSRCCFALLRTRKKCTKMHNTRAGHCFTRRRICLTLQFHIKLFFLGRGRDVIYIFGNPVNNRSIGLSFFPHKFRPCTQHYHVCFFWFMNAKIVHHNVVFSYCIHVYLYSVTSFLNSKDEEKNLEITLKYSPM